MGVVALPHRLERDDLQLRAYARDSGRGLARTRELRQTYVATVQALAAAIEAKDGDTAGHLRRVRRLGLLLADAIAPAEAGDPQLAYAFLLHDIGKLAVPDAILAKPGPLDEGEWEIMRRHPAEGARILGEVPFLAGTLGVVRHHHERWDGRGYPDGLAGEEIPLWARMFAIVDTVDAVTSDRAYRRARPLEVAVEEVLAGAGTQFDPACVDVFVGLPLDAVRAALA